MLIEHLVWIEVCKDPTNVLQYYVYKSKQVLNVDISKNYVSRIFMVLDLLVSVLVGDYPVNSESN